MNKQYLNYKHVLNHGETNSDRFDRNAFVYDNWIRKHRMGRVLDLGCGENHIKAMHGNVVGVDVIGSPDMIIDVEKNELPFEKNSFDCVVCLDFLEHVDNLHQVMNQITDITERFIILSFPNEVNWRYVLKNLITTNDREFGFFPSNRHKWYISYSQARDFIRALCFQHSLILLDDHIEIGTISNILNRIVRIKFPNLLPTRYYVLLKKEAQK